MASNSTTWRYNQETTDTKTFTWRLRAQAAPGHVDPSISRNIKSTAASGHSASRLVTPVGTHTSSSTSLPTAGSHALQNADQAPNFLHFQEFEIEAGQSLGLHSMWSFFLVSCGSPLPLQKSSTNISTSASSSSSPPHPPNSDFVGLFVRKILKTAKSSQSSYAATSRSEEIVAKYKIEILDRDGEVLYTKDCEASPRDKLEEGYWDWKKITTVSKLQTPSKKPLSKDGADDESLLLMRLSFTLLNRRKAPGGNSAASEQSPEETTSAQEAAVTFLALVDSQKSTNSDIIVEIPNRRKFHVHKSVLMGRSLSLRKSLSVEKSTKTLRVDDISANTMELVLRHMYTGQLEEDWATNPVTATELIYVSEKYGLQALKEFCNKHLVRGANKNNCYRLMEVAQLHNLDKAADDLMSYVSEGINSNSRKASAESIDLGNG